LSTSIIRHILSYAVAVRLSMKIEKYRLTILVGNFSGIKPTSKEWEIGRINEGQNGTIIYHEWI
jgi:hypothetical protein